MDTCMPRRWLTRYLRARSEGEDAPEDRGASEPPPTRPRPTPMRPPSLATATRDYARAIEANLLDRKPRADLDRWAASMGAELWSWQRARLLTDQPPWRASPTAEEEHERRRAAERMLLDVATWEKALVVLDAQIARARLYDRPIPPPLVVPREVMVVIEAKRKAALERAGKARTRGEGGGAPPAFRPDEDLSHPPYPKPR